MQDQALLTLLKFCFLALLYLFLIRVVSVVMQELRNPSPEKRVRTQKTKGTLRFRFLEPPQRQGQEVTLGDEMSVGRGGGCGIVLSDDTFASQVHARVYRQGSRFYVEDLKSTNGTFVNGRQVTGASRIRKGDTVRFGQTVAEVVR